jgi:hypothetical protein
VIVKIVPKAAYNKYPITEEKPKEILKRLSEQSLEKVFTKMHGQKLNFN